MPKIVLTPTRINYLEEVISCMLRTERRIRGSFAPDLVLRDTLKITQLESAARVRIRDRVRERGYEPYAQALLNLRVKRSRLFCELHGMDYVG